MIEDSAKALLQRVRDRAARIVEMDDTDADPEAAHAEQDELWLEVLRAVAAGHPDAAEMAAECVRVAETDGTRWYA